MRVFAYERFRASYQALPSFVQRKVDRQLTMLAQNLRYPSLQVKPVKGTRDIWEARVDQHYRLTFERRGDALYLRVVGNHDDVLRNP
jgi:mRNA-degrading endonuclease RelE of RelBE toxin-antitoxin system